MLFQEIRPTTLDEVVGNAATVAALKQSIKSGDRSHCMLFQGPSGCGKTTMARILAAEYGCLPFNLVEINAASQRGIDMARELEKYAQSSPLGGGCRVVILDEAHALTRDAQNALLKVLEDIPEYSYYFLCSTEPKKLLPTILTRAMKLNVDKINGDDMMTLLDKAIKKSGIPDPGDDVLNEIIDNANGCPREALVMLEKQKGLEKEMAIRAVQSHTSFEKGTIDLCRAVVGGTWRDVINTYKRLESPDPENVRRAVLGYLRSCLLKGKPGEAGKFAAMIEEMVGHTYDDGEPALLAKLYQANKVS